MFSRFGPSSKLPLVSVIVLTFNRKKVLENCLKSLYKMNYPISNFEVIVIDGGSTDGTMQMFPDEFPDIRFIVEKRKGRPVARNTGWKYAKGQIVAYTDDDCIVDENWLKFLVSGFDSEEIGAVGGPLFLLHQSKSIHNRFEGTPMGDFYLGDKKLPARELITANLAVRRDVFEKNRFDETLIYDLEDIDFCRSLMATGYNLIYLPEAIVYHNINPKRLTIPSTLKKAFPAGISLYIMERKNNQNLFLIAKFLRKSLGGSYQFVLRRRLADFFWFVRCFVAFLSSMFLVTRRRK
jgi:glycosyltransferase involved in cell wall biosynthesis